MKPSISADSRLAPRSEIRTAAPDAPVFVDPSGRRRRLVKLAATAVGGLLAVMVAVIGASMLGAGPLGLPGWPDADAGPRATNPAAVTAPSPSTRAPGPPGRTPGVSPSPGVVPQPVTGSVPPSGAVPTATTPTPTDTGNPGSGHRATPTRTPTKGRP